MARTLSAVAPGPVRTVAGSVAHRTALDAFVAEIFDRLPRSDQRRWAHVYTRGLLVTPGRKTVRRLAAALPDPATAAQALHQFVNASPWDWAPVRARLADWVVRRSRPRALVLGPVVLPKRGNSSCGVHRRFVPQDGRTVNCQLGVSAFLAADDATVPVDWRLLLPGAWSEDPEVRGRARVPETAGGPQDSAEAQALDLVDEVGRGLPDPHGLPVVADLVGFADGGALVSGLAARRRRFVVAVPGDLVVVPDRPEGGGAGRVPPGAYGRADSGTAGPAGSGTAGARAGAVIARSLLAARRARPQLGPPAGTEPDRAPAPEPAAVATGVVRLPGLPVALRLVCERRTEGTGGPGDGVRVWLTDLVDRPAQEVLALARLHTEAVDTVERLAEDFGLRAFEGRSYPGWHHHMTLVSAAFAYGTLGSATAPPGPPVPAAHAPRAGRPPRGARSGTAPARSAGGPGRGGEAPSRAAAHPPRPSAVPTAPLSPRPSPVPVNGTAGDRPPSPQQAVLVGRGSTGTAPGAPPPRGPEGGHMDSSATRRGHDENARTPRGIAPHLSDTTGCS